jgi:predicted CoA-binding protein
MDWKENILTTDAQVAELLCETKRIAVLGIKPEDHAGQPAFYVPKYMQQVRCEIVPVPVYYPEVTEILGEKVYRRLSEIQGEIDMINIFRRSKDVFQHVEGIIARKPKSVWLQLGIRDDDAAELERAGQLQLYTSPGWKKSENGKVVLEFELPAQGVSLVQLSW